MDRKIDYEEKVKKMLEEGDVRLGAKRPYRIEVLNDEDGAWIHIFPLNSKARARL